MLLFLNRQPNDLTGPSHNAGIAQIVAIVEPSFNGSIDRENHADIPRLVPLGVIEVLDD